MCSAFPQNLLPFVDRSRIAYFTQISYLAFSSDVNVVFTFRTPEYLTGPYLSIINSYLFSVPLVPFNILVSTDVIATESRRMMPSTLTTGVNSFMLLSVRSVLVTMNIQHTPTAKKMTYFVVFLEGMTVWSLLTVKLCGSFLKFEKKGKMKIAQVYFLKQAVRVA